MLSDSALSRIVRALNERGAASPESKAPTAGPERDIRRLTAADFTGPNLGEADGGTSGAPRSPDELLSRYRKLTGK